jgi:hypothetical protein
MPSSMSDGTIDPAKPFLVTVLRALSARSDVLSDFALTLVELQGPVKDGGTIMANTAPVRVHSFLHVSAVSDCTAYA